jgi:anti-sigma factor RsiW
MMTCARAQEFIHAYLDGVISPPDRHTLDGHLAGCASCRRELETTRALLGLLADAPRRRLSDDFDRALSARLAELGPRRSPWPVWGRLWQMHAWRLRPVLMPVAATLAAIVAWQAVPPASNPPPQPERGSYVAQLLSEHEAGARWRELPEAAVDYNLQVSSTASAVADLIQ